MNAVSRQLQQYARFSTHLSKQQQQQQQQQFITARCYTQNTVMPQYCNVVILALRLLAELHREFQKPLHVAYIDIKAAFDSVDRQALWLSLIHI